MWLVKLRVHLERLEYPPPPETWCALIRPFLCIRSIGNHLLVFHSEIRSIRFCRVTDHRRLSEVKGKGLVVPKPCVYIFSGLEVCRQTRSYFYFFSVREGPGTHCLCMRQNSQKSWEFGYYRKIYVYCSVFIM